MWFEAPAGFGGISVQRQEFVPEIKDEEGRVYFRAPDHFAPLILNVGGFKIVEKPPADFPEDLPRADPLRDGAIAQLSKEGEAQKLEMKGLREDLSVAVAKISALIAEKADLMAKLKVAEEKIASLEDELEDKPAPEVKKK